MSKMGWAALVLVGVSVVLAVGAAVMVWGILAEAAHALDGALK